MTIISQQNSNEKVILLVVHKFFKEGFLYMLVENINQEILFYHCHTG